MPQIFLAEIVEPISKRQNHSLGWWQDQIGPELNWPICDQCQLIFSLLSTEGGRHDIEIERHKGLRSWFWYIYILLLYKANVLCQFNYHHVPVHWRFEWTCVPCFMLLCILFVFTFILWDLFPFWSWIVSGAAPFPSIVCLMLCLRLVFSIGLQKILELSHNVPPAWIAVQWVGFCFFTYLAMAMSVAMAICLKSNFHASVPCKAIPMLHQQRVGRIWTGSLTLLSLCSPPNTLLIHHRSPPFTAGRTHCVISKSGKLLQNLIFLPQCWLR